MGWLGDRYFHGEPDDYAFSATYTQKVDGVSHASCLLVEHQKKAYRNWKFCPGHWLFTDGRDSWRFATREIVFREFDHFTGQCLVVRGQESSFCKTHWMSIRHPSGPPESPMPKLDVPCGHCPEKFVSKGKQKEHMAKFHKDILKAQREAHEARHVGNRS